MQKQEGYNNFFWHILKLFGLSADVIRGRVKILIKPSDFDFKLLEEAFNGNIIIVFQPSNIFCSFLGITRLERKNLEPSYFSCPSNLIGIKKYQSLHPSFCYRGEGQSIMLNENGESAWLYLSKNKGGFLLVGTDLISDLIRYRQGNPMALPSEGSLWGIPGERPVYLYEKQISALPRGQERQADFWSMTIVKFISNKLQAPLLSILPNGAPGAIVVTGDDDQAFLEKYDEQLELLNGLPITYLLHPLTRHSYRSLKRMQKISPAVDFGIHPDALETPMAYEKLLNDQCKWFKSLTGRRASSLRNHGFLNDGYWGHLQPWINEGIKFSSNLPGLDGCALNGSFLPARLLYDGNLTDHWSIVTAIGDGIRYIDGGKTDSECANCIFDLADSIIKSEIPGVMVLNLHPQNISDTRAMHLAIREVVQSGFIAWNMNDCLNWFSGENRSPSLPPLFVKKFGSWCEGGYGWI